MCSVISPAQASSVLKIPCAWLTRRERNLRRVFGTIRGSAGYLATSGGGGSGGPHLTQPAGCRANVLRGGCHQGGDRLCLSRDPACVPRASSVHCEVNWQPGGLKGFRDAVPMIHALLLLPEPLSLALITDLEQQLSVKLMVLSEGSPCPLFGCVGFSQPAEIALTYLHSLLKNKTKQKTRVNILCRSQRAMSVRGVFTEVQEIIRLFTVSDCIRVGGVAVFLVGMRVGGGNMSTAEQVLYPRLKAATPPFIIKFESFNKIKQPEKCSC